MRAQKDCLFHSLSFVVNSRDDARFGNLKANLDSVFGAHMPEIVRIEDAQSMAEGLNRGARIARGEWLIFCHDDVIALGKDTQEVLLRAMRDSDMFGPCGTTRLISGNWYDAGRPYTYGHVVARDILRPGKFEIQVFGVAEQGMVPCAQALDGLWIGCRRSLFDALRGFDEKTYTDFVGYDIDLSFRAALAGARVCISCDLALFHDSHVGEFSADKIARWEASQRAFVEVFGRHFSPAGGDRGHDTVPLDRLEDFSTVMSSLRSPTSSTRSMPFGKAASFLRRVLRGGPNV